MPGAEAAGADPAGCAKAVTPPTHPHFGGNRTNYVEILREKTLYRPGGGNHRADPQRSQPDQDDHRPAAGDGSALHDGPHHRPRRKPGKGGERRDQAAGIRPGHRHRRHQRHQLQPGEREHRPAGICRRHQHGLHHGQGQHRPEPGQGLPAPTPAGRPT